MKVFISHSSSDKRFVRTLKDDLNENNIHTWIDEDELELGDSLIDKLETSIEDTSHFLIVLSDNSINSPWVQKELSKVLEVVREKQIFKKIIPIKYKECEVPSSLKDLLFADISNIIRITEGNRLTFYDIKYSEFITRLVRSLRSNDKLLTSSDRKILSNSIEIDNSNDIDNDRDYLSVYIKGFSSSESKDIFIDKLEKLLHRPTKLQIIQSKRPIILPKFFAKIYPTLQIGEKIEIKNKNETRIGLFAGFRKGDDPTIILPASIKNYLGIINSSKIIVISADKQSRQLTIINQ